MAKRIRYTATFADGSTITRSSARAYAVAWRSTWTDDYGERQEVTGFAVSHHRASPCSPCAPGEPFITRVSSSADRSRAKRMRAAYHQRAGYRVEFAPAVAAGGAA